MKEVVDTRFFVEHFYSDKGETRCKTSSKLRDLASRREGLLPTIVMSETFQTVCEKVGKEEAETCFLALMRSRLKVCSLDQNIAREAGLLKCRYRNIPLGDCIIAATAIINKARILSDDPHFDAIKETRRVWI